MNTASDPHWFTVSGKADPVLESDVNESVTRRITEGDFSEHNVKYIEKVDLSLVAGKIDLSDKELEKLRLMCSLWDIDFRSGEITSHRKYIGPIIVAAKKVVFSVVRVLLKPVIDQQRSYNAATIAMVAELARRSR